MVSGPTRMRFERLLFLPLSADTTSVVSIFLVYGKHRAENCALPNIKEIKLTFQFLFLPSQEQRWNTILNERDMLE